MRYKKVLFICQKFKDTDLASIMPLSSFAYLSQLLVENNIECQIFDMNFGYTVEDLFENIHDFSPDIVAFTIFSLGHKDTYELIKKIKFKFGNLAVIVGGPHITIAQIDVLKECAFIDFCSAGEGEELLLKLCNGVELSKIVGLIYREHGKIHFNGIPEFNNNLDSLPFPQLSKFELKKYSDGIIIITSRGCPYSCTYCCGPLILGKKFRTRTAKNVVDELEYHYTNGRTNFFIMDDNFTFSKERVYQICDEIEQRELKDITLNCTNGLRADKVDLDLLKKMKSIGFKRIGIGVEGGNNKILKLLKKGEKIEVIEKAIKNACELGFEVELYFVVGTPGETYEDIQDSINLSLKYPIHRVHYYSLLPFPGTELYDWVEEHNAWVADIEDLLQNQDMNLLRSKGFKGAFVTQELSDKMRKKAYRELRRTFLKVSLKRTRFFGGFIACVGSIGFFHSAYLQNKLIKAAMRRIIRNGRKIEETIFHYWGK